MNEVLINRSDEGSIIYLDDIGIGEIGMIVMHNDERLNGQIVRRTCSTSKWCVEMLSDMREDNCWTDKSITSHIQVQLIPRAKIIVRL